MLITLAVGFASINTGNNLLYLIFSLMLAFLVLSGVLSEASIRGIRVQRRIPHEIFARTPTRVALEVTNTQRYPAYAVVVEDLAYIHPGDKLPSSLGRAFMLRISARGTELRTHRLEAQVRGPFVFTGYRISTRFPFGLFSKSRVVDAPLEVLAFPRIEPTRMPTIQADARFGTTNQVSYGGSGTEATGLRDYLKSDPLRRIHWRASLRRSELTVRDVTQDGRGEATVYLSTRTAPGPAFEAQVSRVASEALQLLEHGIRVALKTDSERIGFGEGSAHRFRLLEFLAEVATDEDVEAAA